MHLKNGSIFAIVLPQLACGSEDNVTALAWRGGADEPSMDGVMTDGLWTAVWRATACQNARAMVTPGNCVRGYSV